MLRPNGAGPNHAYKKSENNPAHKHSPDQSSAFRGGAEHRLADPLSTAPFVSSLPHSNFPANHPMNLRRRTPFAFE